MTTASSYTPDTSKTEEKAQQAAQKRNYDYAVELYLQVLTVRPDHLEARKALRTVEKRRANENGGGGIGTKIMGFIKPMMLPKKGDADKRIRQCEEILKNDPMNRKANVALGQALFDGGYVDSAIWVFEDLRQNHPSDKEVAVMLADVYERAGQVEKALEVHQQIVKLDPGDRASGQRVTELQAMKMQNVFQKGAEAGARNIVKSDKDKKRADRDGAMRTREDVMDAIEDEMEKAEQRPDDPNPRVRVGDLYMRIHDFAKAREQFAKAKEISPTEYRFQMKLDDVKIAEMQHGIKQEKDPEKKKKLYNEMMRFRLESFQKREHHYITDLAIAFELGEIYLAFKKIDEAIKRFQKTSKDPKYRTKSALHLGQAFTEKGQYDLAVRQLSEGIENKAIMDDEKKNLYYIRGTVYEKMGKPEEAKADFMAIYEVEIDFKDVKQKIEGS